MPPGRWRRTTKAGDISAPPLPVRGAEGRHPNKPGIFLSPSAMSPRGTQPAGSAKAYASTGSEPEVKVMPGADSPPRGISHPQPVEKPPLSRACA